MSPRKINQLFQKLSEAIPNPTTELVFHNPFELLISVMLSAQATDVSVNKATPRLFEQFPTPDALSQATFEEVHDCIKTIGLANTKAKNVIKTAGILVEKHQSEVPRTREALEALPGVGRKTANVVLNTAFQEPLIAVDTHVFRVSNRTGLVSAKTVDATEAQLMKVVPKKWKVDAHHYLILHGRYVCKARKPECHKCLIQKQCEFKEKIL